MFRTGAEAKRTYLVVVDDSAESRVALRFAARRAAKTGGTIEVLGIVEPQDFVQFGGVQSAIEEEQRLRIEGVVSSAIGEILDESGMEAKIIIRRASRCEAVRDYSTGATTWPRWCSARRRAAIPGPLVANFTGNDAGQLPCPVMIIPGSLSDERLEQLSRERATISPSFTQPASSSSVNRAVFGLSMSSTPSNSPSRISGTTISLFDALSQAMWPGKALTSRPAGPAGSRQPLRRRLPNGMRMQAGRPWNGPSTNSPPILR